MNLNQHVDSCPWQVAKMTPSRFSHCNTSMSEKWKVVVCTHIREQPLEEDFPFALEPSDPSIIYFCLDMDPLGFFCFC